jgi:hypothetical protein
VMHFKNHAILKVKLKFFQKFNCAFKNLFFDQIAYFENDIF